MTPRSATEPTGHTQNKRIHGKCTALLRHNKERPQTDSLLTKGESLYCVKEHRNTWHYRGHFKNLIQYFWLLGTQFSNVIFHWFLS